MDAHTILRPGISKTKLLEEIEYYDIIHFATHTEIDNDYPLNSKFIVFNSENTDEEDQAVFISDILPLNLKSRMAVLSSCNTGTGKLAKGEGVLSIARSFRYAGCPSVVMSLWELDDISTSKIISEFYHNLSEGMEKDDALRKSKLKYLEEANSKNAAPLFWAGVISSGDQSALTFEKKNFNYYLLIILIILISSGLKFGLKGKRSNT